jgi:hypothetical protein
LEAYQLNLNGLLVADGLAKNMMLACDLYGIARALVIRDDRAIARAFEQLGKDLSLIMENEPRMIDAKSDWQPAPYREVKPVETLEKTVGFFSSGLDEETRRRTRSLVDIGYVRYLTTTNSDITLRMFLDGFNRHSDDRDIPGYANWNRYVQEKYIWDELRGVVIMLNGLEPTHANKEVALYQMERIQRLAKIVGEFNKQDREVSRYVSREIPQTVFNPRPKQASGGVFVPLIGRVVGGYGRNGEQAVRIIMPSARGGKWAMAAEEAKIYWRDRVVVVRSEEESHGGDIDLELLTRYPSIRSDAYPAARSLGTEIGMILYPNVVERDQEKKKVKALWAADGVAKSMLLGAAVYNLAFAYEQEKQGDISMAHKNLEKALNFIWSADPMVR